MIGHYTRLYSLINSDNNIIILNDSKKKQSTSPQQSQSPTSQEGPTSPPQKDERVYDHLVFLVHGIGEHEEKWKTIGIILN